MSSPDLINRRKFIKLTSLAAAGVAAGFWGCTSEKTEEQRVEDLVDAVKHTYEDYYNELNSDYVLSQRDVSSVTRVMGEILEKQVLKKGKGISEIEAFRTAQTTDDLNTVIEKVLERYNLIYVTGDVLEVLKNQTMGMKNAYIAEKQSETEKTRDGMKIKTVITKNPRLKPYNDYMHKQPTIPFTDVDKKTIYMEDEFLRVNAEQELKYMKNPDEMFSEVKNGFDTLNNLYVNLTISEFKNKYEELKGDPKIKEKFIDYTIEKTIPAIEAHESQHIIDINSGILEGTDDRELNIKTETNAVLSQMMNKGYEYNSTRLVIKWMLTTPDDSHYHEAGKRLLPMFSGVIYSNLDSFPSIDQKKLDDNEDILKQIPNMTRDEIREMARITYDFHKNGDK